MPKCRNCGSLVTTAYVRTFTPEGMVVPSVCPACEDRTREETDERREGSDVCGRRERRR